MSNPALEKDPALSSLSPEGILTLTFNRPKALNAMNDWVYNAATKILEQAAKNDAVKVVVVTGSGDKSFCAGADLGAGFDPMVGPLKSGRGSYFDPVGRFMSTVIAFPKPLIAAVNGLAVGVGLTLLPHCDAVYAVPNATFFSPFTQIGVCPEFCSSVLIPRIVGPTLATEVLFFGRKLTAKEAQEARLVCAILPQEGFLEAVYAKIRPSLAHLNSGRSMKFFKGLTRTPEDIAFLDKVHANEMAMLDMRSIGPNSEAAQGVAAMQKGTKAKAAAPADAKKAKL